jgi:hypothetical protein
VAQGAVAGERVVFEELVGPLESCATTTSKRSRASVWSASASSSHRNRSGRSWDATTTAISGAIGSEP